MSPSDVNLPSLSSSHALITILVFRTIYDGSCDENYHCALRASKDTLSKSFTLDSLTTMCTN